MAIQRFYRDETWDEIFSDLTIDEIPVKYIKTAYLTTPTQSVVVDGTVYTRSVDYLNGEIDSLDNDEELEIVALLSEQTQINIKLILDFDKFKNDIETQVANIFSTDE